MISIVICSINDDLLRQVTASIHSSIGVEYELLVWDNRVQQKGLCEVYNLMAVKAKYPYLLFMHEDLLFETSNWGEKLLQKFQDNASLGLVGLAGASYKSKMCSGWYTGLTGTEAYHISHMNAGVKELFTTFSASAATAFDCICLDGVFLMCRKEVWETIRFDDAQLHGFHFYDIDFSLRAAAICKLQVVPDVSVVHLTQGGDYGDKWVEAAFVYHAAATKLPCSLVEIPAGADLQIAKNWLDRLKREKISFSNRIKWITKQKLLLNVSLWYSILKFMLYRPLRLNAVHRVLKNNA